MAKSEDREPATCTSDEDHSPAFLRRFFAMAIPFFNSEERWTARLLGLGVLGLTMLQIGIAIRLMSLVRSQQICPVWPRQKREPYLEETAPASWKTVRARLVTP